ncbi:MAG TPA: phosphate acyltransferase PlsX [Bacillota bacterium]|nr:phosphate acyltransferase PlsX [Bacillota bacterium]
MKIVLDAMGGDRGPAATVAGACAAVREESGLEIVICGPEEPIRAEMRDTPAGVSVLPASEVIGPDEAPAAAFRSKRDSSMAVGLRAVNQGEADAFVSSGNTGALMVGSLLTFGRVAGVDRPAMTTFLPTIDGQGFLMLDLGAHMDASARNLYEFALMGSIYAELVRNVVRPRVALLNVGTEQGKGNEVSRDAYTLLSQSEVNFVGNVEGRDLFDHPADVVVTDGFVGNIVLKTLEGYGSGVSRVLGRELRHSGLITLLGAALAQKTLRRLRKLMDYSEYGGAPFLGVNGVSIKCHGSSDQRAVKNGVLLAARVVRQGVVQRIAARLEKPAAAGI